MTERAIVADIGGTNARFATVNLKTMVLDTIVVYPLINFPTLADAILHYQQQYGLTEIKQAVIAIACPVTDDIVNMTNGHWQFSIREMQVKLSFSILEVINDFTAIAMSLPALSEQEKYQIGTGETQQDKPCLVLGAGTGLGVAYLLSQSSRFVPLAGEGGHISWTVTNKQEWFIQQFLMKKYGRVSAERVLSGPGLEQLYLALAAYQQTEVVALSAKEITQQALTDSSSLAYTTVQQFLASLGCFAGDLTLLLNVSGGVYIAGGIAPSILSLLAESDFRERFEEKGRFSNFNKQVPVYIITAPYPGLLGAAFYLKHFLMDTEYDI